MGVPRIIHHIWLGPPIPGHLAVYRATWAEHHPTWSHRLWTEPDLGWLTNQAVFDNAEAHTRNVGQLRSDIARYEILWRFGGVYVDMDLECLRAVDDLAAVDCFAGWEVQDRWVGNTILGSVPGHPFMGELIAAIPASVRRNRGQRPNKMTGPGLVTRVARHHDDVTIYDQPVFFPYGCNEVGTDAECGPWPNAYTVHHWNNTRTGGRKIRA